MMLKELVHKDFHSVYLSSMGSIDNNKENHDAISFYFIEDDFVLALSDGVNSCKKSALGSQMAVRASFEIFKDLKEHKVATDAFIDLLIAKWHELLQDEILDECAATLKIAMKINLDLYLYSLGDGLLVMQSKDLNIQAPDDDSPFINQTKCLYSCVKKDDFWSFKTSLKENEPYLIFICSDGIASGLKDNCIYELISEIIKTKDSHLKDELISLVSSISEFVLDDKSLGVLKYAYKNA